MGTHFTIKCPIVCFEIFQRACIALDIQNLCILLMLSLKPLK